MKQLFLAFAAALFASACADDVPESRTPIPGTDRSDHAADGTGVDTRLVDRISEATCEREQSCGTIGPGGYFASRDQCLETMRNQLGPKLNPGECPRGVDQALFNRCIDSIRSTECTQPSDQITRSARCSTSDLCMK
jgi:Family of unknown function (DUF6184)